MVVEHQRTVSLLSSFQLMGWLDAYEALTATKERAELVILKVRIREYRKVSRVIERHTLYQNQRLQNPCKR
jgi:hypothetical protein